MRFRSIKLSSWKNFKSADAQLAQRMFIIGANAAGKSNFLEAFRFLHDLTTAGGGLARAVSLREGMPKLRSLHATRNSTIIIEVEIGDDDHTLWTYKLEFDTATRTSPEPIIKSEKVTKGETILLDRPTKGDRHDPERLKQTAIEQTSINKEFRDLVEFFRSIRSMSLVPQLIREGQANPRIVPGQDPLGRDLLDTIRACAERYQKARLNRIEAILKHVVPSFSALRLEIDERGRPHLAVSFKHWRQRGARQRETQFSDGTLRLIGMLWALQEPGGPLLLEEPEWSLHTGIIEQLAPFIARMQRPAKRQVLITTHNDRLLSDAGIQPEEVLLITPAPKGGSQIQSAATHSAIAKAMKSGLNAAEAAQPHTRPEQGLLFEASA